MSAAITSMNTVPVLDHGAAAPPPRRLPATRRERRVPNGTSALLRATSLVVALVAVLFAAGCATPAPRGSPPPPVVLTPANSDSVVTVPLGGVLEIRLPSAPDTGYRWDIDRLDPGPLAPAGPPEFVPDPDRPGGAGTTVFRFRAVRVGNGMLRLAHRLPWEQANKGETFTAMVKVREG